MTTAGLEKGAVTLEEAALRTGPLTQPPWGEWVSDKAQVAALENRLLVVLRNARVKIPVDY
jgi:hypothetical protein